MNRWMILSIAITLLAFGGPLYLYYAQFDLLKDEIPTHSNAHGVVDKTTAREDILFQWLLLPGAMVLFLALSLVLPWLSPKGYEVDRFLRTFQFLICLVVALFGYIHLLLVLGGLKGVDFDTENSCWAASRSFSRSSATSWARFNATFGWACGRPGRWPARRCGFRRIA